MKRYLTHTFDFAQLVPVFDELPLWSAPFGLKLLEHIDYQLGIKVLDIGFGTGFPLTELAMRLGPTATVYGIDPWKEAAVRVLEKIAYYDLSNVHLIEGVAESIPLADHSIDLVTSNNGLNNVQDLAKSISECARVLKAGGQMVQTMNTNLSMFEFYHQLERVLVAWGMPEKVEAMHEHIAHKRPPVERVVTLMQQNGFEIRDLEHHQFNYRFADGTAMLHHYFIRLAFMDAWKLLLPPDRIAEGFEVIETRLNDQARAQGGLKLSIPFVVMKAVKA